LVSGMKKRLAILATVALLTAAVGCSCNAIHPYCWKEDKFCYKSWTSYDYSISTCPGSCTSSWLDPSHCGCSELYPFCSPSDQYCYRASSSYDKSSTVCPGVCNGSYSRLGSDYLNTSIFDFTQISVHVPRGYDGSVPLPLVLNLPGYATSPDTYLEHSSVVSRINEDKFIAVTPAGRLDDKGRHYWSAWGYWCGQCRLAKDKAPGPYPCHELCGDGDVEYLRELVFAVACTYNVDETMIFACGQSHGAAMAYRLACDASDIFAGVIAVDGPPPEDNWKAGYRCEPSNPINVLHVHGTLDAVVGYDGLLQTWTQKKPLQRCCGFC